MEIPTWLLFSLISPAFWAIVHVLDSHCVDEVFDRPWIGIVTGALTMMMALPFLCIGLLLTAPVPMSLQTILLCLLCGSFFMTSQILYFQSLSITESGIVAAYWNFIPMLLPAVSFLLFGEILTAAQYVGAALLIAASVIFCVLDGDLESRWSSFWMMFLGAILQVAYFLIQKQVFAVCPVYQSFLAITVAMIATGLSPLLIPRFRRVFSGNWPRIRSKLPLLSSIEIANLIAVATSQMAVSHGTPSLVSAVEASIPGYTFALSMILYATTGKYGEEEAREFLPGKLCLVATMMLGVWLVS